MTAAPALPATLSPAGAAVARALDQRLRTVAPHVLDSVPYAALDPTAHAGLLLSAMVEQIRATGDLQRLWLLWTALASAYPTSDELLEARRVLELSAPVDGVAWLLEAAHRSLLNAGTPAAELEIVTGAVVLDVDFCATSRHHTGIQRVVRETAPRWVRDHEVLLAGWTVANGALRRLTAEETDRVLRWSELPPDTKEAPAVPLAAERPAADTLVVPWRSVVVVLESAEPQRCPALAALAEHSGNAVTAIGYDCIPVVSPELIHPGLPDRFVLYLSVIKHARTVAAISATATAEFRGFTRMLPSQGLPGPAVVEVPLPVEVPAAALASPAAKSAVPTVVSVGSFEPRKNQLAVLHAAERLWREGHRFALRFVGGGGWRTEFEAEMNRLAAAGRDVRRSVQIDDDELWRLYRSARFSVFTSLHEGYGLPVAESLACGTPVLTTDYGSTAEIAAEGGALTVDPRDDEAVLDAMRRLLTDDDLIERLGDAARRRPSRTWDDYARELWQALATPGTLEDAA